MSELDMAISVACFKAHFTIQARVALRRSDSIEQKVFWNAEIFLSYNYALSPSFSDKLRLRTKK